MPVVQVSNVFILDPVRRSCSCDAFPSLSQSDTYPDAIQVKSNMCTNTEIQRENVKYKYKRTGRQGRPKVRRIGGMFALHVISSPTDQCSRLFFTNIINTNTKLHLLVSSLFMQIYLCILHPIYSEHYFCTFTFVLIDDSSCYEDMQCILCIRIPSS